MSTVSRSAQPYDTAELSLAILDLRVAADEADAAERGQYLRLADAWDQKLQRSLHTEALCSNNGMVSSSGWSVG